MEAAAKTADINFEDIMTYSDGNKSSFESLCTNFDTVVPFVGAGLSAFVYPCWCDFLREASQSLETDEKGEFSRLVEKRDYEQAASILENRLGGERFRSDIKAAFGSEKLYAPELVPVIHKQAAFLLPELFKGLVLTTNFDCTLERVYELHGTKFKNVGHPGNASLLRRALARNDSATLYKFHGDISQAEDLVLTKERYDSCYQANGTLARGLRACFKLKSMLFLGCSLAEDRTMGVLQSVLQSGACHYAILGCNRENLDKRRHEMSERCIRAIFYPAAEHDAVRAILEKLTEDLSL